MSALGPTRPGCKNPERSVIRVDVRCRQDVLGKGGDQRAEQLAARRDPLHEGRAAQLQTRVGEDLTLPIQRQVKTVLPGQNQRKERCSRETLLDRARGRRRLHDRRALPAAPLRPDVPGHRERDRLDLEYLRLVLAELVLRLGGGVMLDHEALEPLHIVRQCVDVEHARIIRAALEVRTREVRVYCWCCCRTYVSGTLCRPRRRHAILILWGERRALLLLPINTLEQHRQLRCAQGHRPALRQWPDELPTA
jgi:hypothetical protein